MRLRTYQPSTSARPGDYRLPDPVEVWQSRDGMAGFAMHLLEEGVVLAVPWGAANLEVIELYGRTLDKLLERMGDSSISLVLDYRKTQGITPEARKHFQAQLRRMTVPLRSMIFIGIKPMMRVLLRLAQRMNSYPYPLFIRDDLPSAVELARQLRRDPDLVPELATPRRLRWKGMVPGFLLRSQVDEFREHIAEFPWDKQDTQTSPFPKSHPFHDLFEMWGAVRQELDLMDSERRQHEAQLQEALQALRASEHRYRAVFEASGAAMVLFGDDRRILMANDAAIRLSGLRRDQMEGGLDWTSLVHPEDLPRLLDYHRNRLRDSALPSRYECRFIDASGAERITAVTVEAVPDTSLRVASLDDLTETRRAEAEIVRLARNLEQRVLERTRELEDANQKLGAALKSREEFLASMSHELRTPLASILNLAESIQAEVYGKVPERIHHPLATIGTNGQHLLDLITDILDLSKSQAGKLEVQLQPLDLHQCVREAAGIVQPNADQRNISMLSEFLEEPQFILGDPRRVRQMIVNLLSNAVKFTPANRRIGVRSSVSPDPRFARVSVWDEGIGIPEEQIQRLFQPFVQLDNRLSREHSGTGLGLSLTRTLVELHSGRIGLESMPGVGTIFHIDLPLSSPPAEPRERAKTAAMHRDAMGNLRVLVIEDNDDLRTVLVDYLEAGGQSVSSASTGPDGLALLERLPFDVVLLDIQMPGMDGLEVLRRIRTRWSSDLLPVIAMTGLAFEEDVRACKEAGANMHLAKPLRMADLMSAIMKLGSAIHDG